MDTSDKLKGENIHTYSMDKFKRLHDEKREGNTSVFINR